MLIKLDLDDVRFEWRVKAFPVVRRCQNRRGEIAKSEDGRNHDQNEKRKTGTCPVIERSSTANTISVGWNKVKLWLVNTRCKTGTIVTNSLNQNGISEFDKGRESCKNSRDSA